MKESKENPEENPKLNPRYLDSINGFKPSSLVGVPITEADPLDEDASSFTFFIISSSDGLALPSLF